MATILMFFQSTMTEVELPRQKLSNSYNTAMAETLLIVDDEQGNLDALKRLFRKDYNVLTALSGSEALELLEANDVQVIISDQRMPKMTGVELLEKSLEVSPKSVRILLTGYADIESVISAINTGQIYRYVTKPWDSADLKNTVATAMEKFSLRNQLETKNRELALAVEKLKELDAAKTKFMMLVNHELKTPLTGISSFLDLLKESKLDEEQSLFVSRIDRNTQRLHKMIEEVMELISAQTGKTTVQTDVVSSQIVIDKLVNKFEETAKSKNLKFAINNQVDNLNADQKIIEKVLFRITDNAVKFAENDSEIQVNCIENDGKVQFKVLNKGHIDQEKISKILEPFTLDENMMNHSKGLGLGLSISDALLKCHKSQLQIDSADDHVSVSFDL